MKATVKLNDRVTLQIDDPKEMDTLHKAIALSNYPKKCSKCGGTQVFLISNKDKEGNTYVSVLCVKCGAKAKMGQYKTGGYFWHREFEVYTKGNKNIPTEQPEQEPEETEDVPF